MNRKTIDEEGVPPPFEESPAADSGQRHFPCHQCGGELTFNPGCASLTCAWCGHVNAIPRSEEDIEELDYHAHLSQLLTDSEDEAEETTSCDACGAVVSLDSHVAADACPFCGTSITNKAIPRRVIKPASLLPFSVTREVARERFRNWLHGLWFAPSSLKERARRDHDVNGIYLPHWTYDCDTTTFYRGERGDNYTVTVSYRDAQGKHRTRQETRTRWSSVSGTVWNSFDDILVNGSKSLPAAHVNKLEPWDLEHLVPYDQQYIAGFRSELHQVSLEEGFTIARELMNERIRRSVARDIGGDHQRIHSMRSSYDNLTFKHILLPVWLSAYKYNQRVYRFMVNARTGEVRGERPYSWIKITLTVLIAILAVLVLFLAFAR